MRSLLDTKKQEPNSLTIETLIKRTERERMARAAAETLLEEKSRELYVANKTLQQTANLLDDQRLQLNTILDHTLSAIILVNDDLRIRRINRSAQILFGLDDQKVTEVTILDLFKNSTQDQEFLKKLLEAKQSTNEAMFEATGRHYNGTEFPIEFGLTHIMHDNKHQTVWIIRDNTARKRAEAKRIALEHELSQAHKMEALGTLASGVAHEINTPVQYVSDNIRFLQANFQSFKELIDAYQQLKIAANAQADLLANLKNQEASIDLEFILDETPKAIEQSLAGMAQVASIVKAIKEFSHPGEEEKVLLDLNKAIETILTVSRNQWKYVAETQLDFDKDLPLLSCLPSDINQVILNLVVNAADAIESAGVKPGLIKLSTRNKADHIEVRIADNGCGIPENVKGRIFDPFFTTKDVGKGTGQGLAISYSIICRKHGGSIEVESEKGKGVCFIIKLPKNEIGGTKELS